MRRKLGENVDTVTACSAVRAAGCAMRTEGNVEKRATSTKVKGPLSREF